MSPTRREDARRPSPAARTRRGNVAAAAAIAALVAGLGGAPARAALRPAYGGTAVAGAAGPLEEKDPARARSDAERLVAAATSCTLADVLAAPPEALDGGRRLRLRLQDNLFFHDGTRLVAADVVRSLVRLTDPAFGASAAWRLLAVEGVAERLAGGQAKIGLRATGPATLEVDLAVPGVDLVALLDDPRLPIVTEDGRGCGPFVRTDAPGRAEVALAPFSRHPAGRPFLDRLVVRAVDPADGGHVLSAGGVDVAFGRVARKLGRAEGPPREATFLVAGGGRAPARARALADALEAAVDRDALVRFLVGGSAQPMAGLLPPGDEAAAAPAPTPAASYRTPPRLSLAFDPGREVHRWVAERIQVRLHDLGTEVVLVPESGANAAAHDLALVTLTGLPARPREALVAVVDALEGPLAARDALARVTAAGDDPRALAAVAADVGRTIPAVPLYAEPDALWVRAGLLGLEPGASLPVDPAELWRWPLAAPPKDAASP